MNLIGCSEVNQFNPDYLVEKIIRLYGKNNNDQIFKDNGWLQINKKSSELLESFIVRKFKITDENGCSRIEYRIDLKFSILISIITILLFLLFISWDSDKYSIIMEISAIIISMLIFKRRVKTEMRIFISGVNKVINMHDKIIDKYQKKNYCSACNRIESNDINGICSVCGKVLTTIC